MGLSHRLLLLCIGLWFYSGWAVGGQISLAGSGAGSCQAVSLGVGIEDAWTDGSYEVAPGVLGAFTITPVPCGFTVTKNAPYYPPGNAWPADTLYVDFSVGDSDPHSLLTGVSVTAGWVDTHEEPCSVWDLVCGDPDSDYRAYVGEPAMFVFPYRTGKGEFTLSAGGEGLDAWVGSSTVTFFTSTPEPSAFVLFGSGLLAWLLGFHRKQV